MTGYKQNKLLAVVCSDYGERLNELAVKALSAAGQSAGGCAMRLKTEFGPGRGITGPERREKRGDGPEKGGNGPGGMEGKGGEKGSGRDDRREGGRESSREGKVFSVRKKAENGGYSEILAIFVN